MAFNDKEQEIIKFGVENGKSRAEVEAALVRYRTGAPVQAPTVAPAAEGYSLAEAGGDLQTGFNEATDAVSKGFETADQAAADVVPDMETGKAKLSPFSAAAKTIGAGFRAGAGVVGAGVNTVARLLAPENAEQAVGNTVQAGAQAAVESDPGQYILSKYNELDDEKKALVDGALGTAEGLATLFGAGPVVGAVKTAAQKSVGSMARERVGTLFVRPSTSVDDVIAQADSATAATRAAAEGSAPAISIKEKWVGISPDIKRRIAGKPEKMQDYFDVAHARNSDDTLPTVYEYGAQQADKAVMQMETLLNETGGKIGQTRQKLGTYKATPDQVGAIEQRFVEQLGKLNLEVRGGVVRQIPGTITKAGSGDVKILNDLYRDVRVIKQSPDLTRIIELRSAVDGRVNFAKSAREASNEIDPFARQFRKELADVGAQIVGKEQAAELKRFSDFMDAYNDLKGYTDRKAGGEYLLRLVLSGRGGDARQIIQTIREYTGIDLMDDATMMTIATDVIANPRQQNLFRQEVTKAGLDAARILSGDVKGGAAGLISDLVTKNLLDQEKIYLDAAR